MWDDSCVIKSHVVLQGFVKGYTIWTKHGEEDTTSNNNDGVGDGQGVEAQTCDMTDDDDQGLDGCPEIILDDEFNLEEMLRHAEPSVRKGKRKGCDNFEVLEKAAAELLYDKSNASSVRAGSRRP